MPVNIGSNQAAFGSRALDQNQTITSRPAGRLGGLKQLFSRRDQLFVPNAQGNFIASGATRADFTKLKQVDLSTAGSLRLENLDTARKVLSSAGLSNARIDGMSPKTLINYSKAVAGNEANAALLLELEDNVSAGQLDVVVVDRLVNINTHSPQLAGKIISAARNEVQQHAQFPAGISEFMSRVAERDDRLIDMRGYPRPDELVGLAEQYGFEPKLHVKLDPAAYQAAKNKIQSYQNVFQTFPNVRFDDANDRIDFGYGIEEIVVTNKGKRLPLPPHVVDPGNIGTADFLESSDKIEGLYKPSRQDEVIPAFSNPNHLSERQSERLQAVADTFRNYHQFDYATYDQAITPVVNQQLEAFAARNPNDQFITEALTSTDRPGLVLGESHAEAEGKQFITANMARFAAEGVRVIGLEHLNIRGIQAEVDAFIDAPAGQPMTPVLTARLRGLAPDADNNCLIDLINAAKTNGIQVVAINAEGLRPAEGGPADPMAMPMRDAMMNAIGENALKARLTDLTDAQNPNPKFVILAGKAHTISHDGMFDHGIPGFGQIFNAPVAHIEPRQGGAGDFPITLVNDDPTVRTNRLVQPDAPATHSFLNQLSGKGEAIGQRLTEDNIRSLDDTLFHATKEERESIEALLHFSYRETGDSTPEGRLQIRTILAKGLSEGAQLAELRILRRELVANPEILSGLDGALSKGVSFTELNSLRTLLESQPPGTVRAIARDLSKPDIPVGGAISRNLLDLHAPDAREKFNNLRPLLTLGPAVPGQANQGVYADDNIALRRDANGSLEIANVDVAFTELQAPAANQNLSAQQVADIKNVFKEIAATPYSHQPVILDFMEHFQREKSADSTVTMGRALETYVPDGAASMEKYGRGDCICQAEAIVNRLNEMGIDARVGGMNNVALTRQKPFGVQPGDVGAHTGNVTHTEVLIPYTDTDGTPRILGLTTGGGPQEKWIADNELTTGGIIRGLEHRFQRDNGQPRTGQVRLRVAPDGGTLDTASIQKAQLGFRSVISLVNTDPTVTAPTQKEHSNVNMLRGVITLSTRLTGIIGQNYTFGNSLEGDHGQLEFDYRDALANPDELVDIVQEGPYGPIPTQLTKLNTLSMFVRAIQRESDLPNDFFNNTMLLLTNEAAYRDEIFLGDVEQLSQWVMPGKKQAEAHRPPEGDPRLPEWQQLVADAERAVGAGNFVEATQKYESAANV